MLPEFNFKVEGCSGEVYGEICSRRRLPMDNLIQRLEREGGFSVVDGDGATNQGVQSEAQSAGIPTHSHLCRLHHAAQTVKRFAYQLMKIDISAMNRILLSVAQPGALVKFRSLAKQKLAAKLDVYARVRSSFAAAPYRKAI